MGTTTKKDGYLTGKLLLATPAMGDPRFHRAVILMCAHDENGAMGLMVNHSLPGVAFHDLVKQLKIESDIMIDFSALHLPVMNGGPVEAARGFLLHSIDFHREETVTVDDAYGITGTLEALKDIAAGRGPDHLLFILGYAGWSAGQLDQEIQDNAWLVVDPNPEIIFHANPDEKWPMAVRSLGIDPGMLSSLAGRA
ncbi:MAG: YqgE/AlgH family protein [Alphaproteobacteria bacterium]|nr:YqgE/AlgH family protein [Alphaproteobacteria bacterium]